MGAELAQWNEWHYEYSLDWHLLQYEPHRQTQEFFKAANAFYLEQPALWEQDDSWQGFQWLCADDNQANTVSFLRWDKEGSPLLVVCNFSPVHRKGYRVGTPFAGMWSAVLNTDDVSFGGGGLGDQDPVRTEYIPCHDQDQSMEIDLPPMAARHLPLYPQVPQAQAQGVQIGKNRPRRQAPRQARRLQAEKRGITGPVSPFAPGLLYDTSLCVLINPRGDE